MLHEFLTTNRAALIERCRTSALRRTPGSTNLPLEHGIPLFLEQLIKTLRVEQTSDPMQSRKVSGPSDGRRSGSSEIGGTAAQHGLELLAHGFTVDQVVHDYGDLCQAITELALQNHERVGADEFQTLNRCLDNAIADAVSEYSYEREVLLAEKSVQSLNEKLGYLAHELRNYIHVGALAFNAIKAGRVGTMGATSAVVDSSFIGLRNLIDRTLADVRLTAGMPTRNVLMSVADFIAEVKVSASLEAQTRKCKFTVAVVEPRLAVDADRELLMSAVGNLLQNAFKYTRPHSEVLLHVYGSADRVRIEVEDQCGGLPKGFADIMFLPFTQGSADKSGLGLGLSICQRVVEANNGVLSVHNKPGEGCIFTIDLPRHALANQPAKA